MTKREFEKLVTKYRNLSLKISNKSIKDFQDSLNDSLFTIAKRINKYSDARDFTRQQERIKNEIKDEFARLEDTYNRYYNVGTQDQASLGIDYIEETLTLSEQSGFRKDFTGLVNELTLDAYKRNWGDDKTILDRLDGLTNFQGKQAVKILLDSFNSGESATIAINKMVNIVPETSSWKVSRLIYTEYNLTYGNAKIKSAEKWNENRPEEYKIYFEWRTNPNHRVFDECDLYNGKVFKSKDLVPILHPNCLCYIVPVMKSIEPIEPTTPQKVLASLSKEEMKMFNIK
jgi:SPP1 gp7 family putative phage head morphogenesis protein